MLGAYWAGVKHGERSIKSNEKHSTICIKSNEKHSKNTTRNTMHNTVREALKAITIKKQWHDLKIEDTSVTSVRIFLNLPRYF